MIPMGWPGWPDVPGTCRRFWEADQPTKRAASPRNMMFFFSQGFPGKSQGFRGISWGFSREFMVIFFGISRKLMGYINNNARDIQASYCWILLVLSLLLVVTSVYITNVYWIHGSGQIVYLERVYFNEQMVNNQIPSLDLSMCLAYLQPKWPLFDLKIRTRKMEVCHPQRGQLCSKCLHIYIYILCVQYDHSKSYYIYIYFFIMLLS